MDDYKKHEAARKRIRKANEGLIGEVEASLETSDLSKTTIDKHVHNTGFYIN